MTYYLSPGAVLKQLESPSVYHMAQDELYELDEDAFDLLRQCSSPEGCSGEEDEFIRYCVEEGILTKDRGTRRNPLLLQSPVPSLRYLELQITDSCNLMCRHCYIDRAGSRELSVDEVRKVAAEFEDMQGLRLLITGGEPLLHSRFSEINETLAGFSFRRVLFTNGLLVSPEMLRTLNVHELQISIDGLEASHDSLRGKGSFRISMGAVRQALDAGLAVSVATMVHRNNLNDFEELDGLFRGLGVKEWTVDVPCVTGRLGENPELHVGPEEGGRYLSYGYGSGLHGGSPGYGCGLHLMAVMADGSAAKCTFYGSRPVGTIREGLRSCWERIRPVRMDSLRCDCVHLEGCRGGCRFRAELLGDPAGRDLYRCALYR